MHVCEREGERKRQRHCNYACDASECHLNSTCFVFNQEKYKRDQEKLQAEWLKAQQEIAKNTQQQEVRKKKVVKIMS